MTGLCVAIVACQVGPDAPPVSHVPQDDAYLPVPDEGAVSITAQPDPRWWESLHDETLDGLILSAEANNQTLAAAAASVRSAYAAVGATEAQLWPTIGAGAQFTRTQTNIAQLASQGVRLEPFNTYAYGLGMQSWEIDLWGGVRRQVESAQASAAASVDALRDAMVSVRSQVAASYLQLCSLQAKRAVLQANRNALATSRDLVKARLDAGTTNALDLARAQADLDSVDAQLPEIDAGISHSISTISVLCGESPARIAALIGQDRPLPTVPDVVGIGLPAEIIDRRPDVRGAHQKHIAASAAIGAAEAMRYPTLALSGNFYLASNSVSGLDEMANKAYSFGPSLFAPLFTGGKIDSAVRQRRAEAERALAQYRQAVLVAIGDVSASISDFVHARQTSTRADAALASARRALQLAQQRFDAGVTDYSVLLDVQRSVLEAENATVDAHSGVAQGFVALQRALGAGWSESDIVLPLQGTAGKETNEITP